MSRQAYAGLLWSKQFYHYIIHDWLFGDPETPSPPRERLNGRNSEAEWRQLFNRDIVSMPDKWEYPWVCLGHAVLTVGRLSRKDTAAFLLDYFGVISFLWLCTPWPRKNDWGWHSKSSF